MESSEENGIGESQHKGENISDPQTKKKLKFDKILLFVIIGALIILIALAVFAFSESGKCLRNPYIYGVMQQGGNVECSCQQFNTLMCPAQFYFNSSGITIMKTKCGETPIGKYLNLEDLKNNTP